MPSFRPISILCLLISLQSAGVAAAGRTQPVISGKAGAASRPFMGWSSWSFIRGDPTQAKIKAQARVMAAKLKKYGYTYVNIDSGWTNGFDRFGRPRVNRRRFPAGIASLAGWLHHHGLKLGLYLVPGMPAAVYKANCRILGTHVTARQIADPNRPGNTLSRNFYKLNFKSPGAMAYVQSQANLLAGWGVDYLKLDFVGPGGGYPGLRQTNCRPEVRAWETAIKRTGRPIWLELSNSLALRWAPFWKRWSNGWRITGDIEAYHTPFLTSWKHVLVRFAAAPRWVKYAGPGGWNDLDSLEIGNGAKDGLTVAQRRTVMTLWCINCAPLCLGANLEKLTPGDLKIITNRSLIAIDQAGVPGKLIQRTASQQVWVVKRPKNVMDVAFFNLGSAPAQMQVRLSALGFANAVKVKNIWRDVPPGRAAHRLKITVAPGGTQLLQLSAAH